jgi:DNA-binding beta-propeller fold protein YncE
VDSDNNRVLVFMAPLINSEAATLLIGQPDFTSKHCNRGTSTPSADTLCGPKGLAIDPSSGNLWVAEDDNSRVLEYNDPLHSGSTDISANLVYGEPNFSTVACNVGANGVCHPDHVALGRFGQLIISDGDNNRLLVVNKPLSNTTANLAILELESSAREMEIAKLLPASESEQRKGWFRNALSRGSTVTRSVKDILEDFIKKYPLLKGGFTVFRELLDLFK